MLLQQRKKTQNPLDYTYAYIENMERKTMSKNKLFWLYATTKMSLYDEFGDLDKAISELKYTAKITGIIWDDELAQKHPDTIMEELN